MKIISIDIESATGDGRGICEIGLYNNEVSERIVIRPPNNRYFKVITNLITIKPSETKNAPEFKNIIPKLNELIENSVLVSWSMESDARMLESAYKIANQKIPETTQLVCIKELLSTFIGEIAGLNLKRIANYFDVKLNAHSALDDARATYEIMNHILDVAGLTLDEAIKISLKKNRHRNLNVRALNNMAEVVNSLGTDGHKIFQKVKIENNKLENIILKTSVVSLDDMIRIGTGKINISEGWIINDLAYESILAINKYKYMDFDKRFNTQLKEINKIYVSKEVEYYYIEKMDLNKLTDNIEEADVIALNTQVYRIYSKYGKLPLKVCNELASKKMKAHSIPIVEINTLIRRKNEIQLYMNNNKIVILLDGWKIAEALFRKEAIIKQTFTWLNNISFLDDRIEIRTKRRVFRNIIDKIKPNKNEDGTLFIAEEIINNLNITSDIFDNKYNFIYNDTSKIYAAVNL